MPVTKTVDIPDNTARWEQDPEAWEAHGGMTVTQRMKRLKSALKKAQDALDQEEKAKGLDDVMESAVASMLDSVPADLRPKLPWSAMINLINAGLSKVGWSFLGRKGDRHDNYTREDHAWAVRAALEGVSQWLPDTALKHEALPTVSPSEAAPELTLAEYQAMWPVDYPAEPVLRVLAPGFPRRPYKARVESESKTIKGRGAVRRDVHWGQRKLFMNEIELLTLYARAGDVVVYAGGAPGTHLKYLAGTLFPVLTFVLVDPAPFATQLQGDEQFELRSELMTDEIAREFAGRGNVIFVSDIRRTYASEDLIKEDMSDQQRWHDIIRPKVSMLKFRLPWLPGETEYLSGKVYTQPYAKPRSTEMRLIATGSEKRTWSNGGYEEQCFFFNTIIREATHRHGVDGCALEDSWDCAAEVEILREYLKSRRPGFAKLTEQQQSEQIAVLSACITLQIGGEQAHQWKSRMTPEVLQQARQAIQPHTFGKRPREQEGRDGERRRSREEEGREGDRRRSRDDEGREAERRRSREDERKDGERRRSRDEEFTRASRDEERDRRWGLLYEHRGKKGDRRLEEDADGKWKKGESPPRPKTVKPTSYTEGRRESWGGERRREGERGGGRGGRRFSEGGRRESDGRGEKRRREDDRERGGEGRARGEERGRQAGRERGEHRTERMDEGKGENRRRDEEEEEQLRARQKRRRRGEDNSDDSD